MAKDIIFWSEAYSVGNDRIDKQHKQLVALINRLYHLYQNKEADEISRVYHELKEYALYHFQTEEKLLEEINYHEAAKHAAAHKEFIQDLNAMYAENMNSPFILALILITFMQRWLTSHILKEDKKYAGHLL